jgi:hypothetical protein
VAKNLIIGGFTNYGINELKPWVLSAKEVAPNDDVVLMYGNASQETIDWVKEQGVIAVPMIEVSNVPIHVLRFLSIYEFLHQNSTEYEYVVTTDVKDVYFQTDPFEQFRELRIGFTGLLVASEGLKYKDEPWGNENLYQAYGPYVYDKFKDNEIFNVGTFGGTSEYVKDMVFHIFTNGINRPIPIVDQAVFNVLINTQPFKDNIVYTHNWACELGTVMDPSKIDSFRPNLLFSEPIWKENQMMLPPLGNRPFAIVHQYDRVPEIKKFVQEKYGQVNPDDMFIYRV